MKNPLFFRASGDLNSLFLHRLGKPTGQRHRPFRRNPAFRGFTLVEVALAIALSSFAFVGVVGLLPVGLSTSRRATDNSLGTYIAQRVIGELVQTDFTQLITDDSGNTTYQANDTFCKKTRYFDGEGNEVTSGPLVIYCVNTRIMPATPVSSGDGGTAASNPQMATITVQVATNPAGLAISREEGGSNDVNKPLRNLWKATAAIPLATHSAFVARAN